MSQSEIEVRIWLTEVGPGTDRLLPRLLARLDREVLARVLRMQREADRVLHAVANTLLRAALAAEGVDAPRFRRGSYGKPELYGAGSQLPVCFNLSHTDGLAACAVVQGHAVGLDVEVLGRRLDVGALARAVLKEEEQAELLSAPNPVEAFLDIWTVKEAVAKAVGLGLRLPFRSIRVTLVSSQLRFAPELGMDEADWHVERHQPTPRHRLAVAIRRPAGAAVTVTLRRVQAEELA
jgi:4'-phosphopantetheinyl transferase